MNGRAHLDRDTPLYVNEQLQRETPLYSNEAGASFYANPGYSSRLYASSHFDSDEGLDINDSCSSTQPPSVEDSMYTQFKEYEEPSAAMSTPPAMKYEITKLTDDEVSDRRVHI